MDISYHPHLLPWKSDLRKRGLPYRLSLGKLRYLWHRVSTHLENAAVWTTVIVSFKINAIT